MAIRKSGLWVIGSTLAILGQPVFGSPPAKPSQASADEKKPMADVSRALEAGKTPAVATIERIMDQAVKNIALRYNLNDVQTEETSKLMRRDVYRFLREHESEVWPVIRDLLQAQLRTPSDPERMKRVGKAARPLLELAKESIFRGNEEWRHILNEEQRRVHDFDLAEMKTTFEKIDERFSQWEEGKRPGDDTIFPQPRLVGQPARPRQPEPGKLPIPRKDMFDPKHIFETMVEAFIREYQLKEGQITSARSILAEFVAKANDFRIANKDAFEKVIAEQQDALRKRDLAAVKRAAVEHKKLLQPIYALGEQMNTRLKGLLETAQIQRHDERMKTAARRRKPVEAKKASSTETPTSDTDPSQPGY